MAVNMQVDGEKLDSDLTSVADAIRAQSGKAAAIAFPDGFVKEIGKLSGGGGAVTEKDVNFYDYDGTLLAAWTLEELTEETELPGLPSRPGLVCQGWNWTLEALKAAGQKMNVGAVYITDDGKTRIYIHLEEGRTSPALGCCPNGTVTVDWGDGTEPDTLTGTSLTTVVFTPNHAYAAPGDYMITLAVSGTMAFKGGDYYSTILNYSATRSPIDYVYLDAVLKIEIGSGVTRLRMRSFESCYSLACITIPNSVVSIQEKVFEGCRSLVSVTLPNGVSGIPSDAFASCYSLTSVMLPNSLKSIGSNGFSNCRALPGIRIPESVNSIEARAFMNCHDLRFIKLPASITAIKSSSFLSCAILASVVTPEGITTIEGNAFSECYNLKAIVISNGVTSIAQDAFSYCRRLASVTIPSGVTNIAGYSFSSCYGVRFYDFSSCTSIPTLANSNAFTGIPSDCEIRVPAALAEEWKAATNWATYADYIVGV